jgi:hypothetical protein
MSVYVCVCVSWRVTVLLYRLQGRTRDQVDLVLLAGGASRMPKLQQWVQGASVVAHDARLLHHASSQPPERRGP